MVKRNAIGWVSCEPNVVEVGECKEVTLEVELTNFNYLFSCVADGVRHDLGMLQTKYLSSEVAGGFTGVMIALFAQSDVETEAAIFSDFEVEYN